MTIDIYKICNTKEFSFSLNLLTFQKYYLTNFTIYIIPFFKLKISIYTLIFQILNRKKTMSCKMFLIIIVLVCKVSFTQCLDFFIPMF